MELQLTLNDGTSVPVVGLGCWMGAAGGGQRVYDMCEKALKIGYRHIDTAMVSNMLQDSNFAQISQANEKEVGKALKDTGIPRSQVYITTKLGGSGHLRVRESFEKSLQELDCDYIDLYLMHWPQAMDPNGQRWLQPDESPTFIETWKEMERLLDTGKVKSIGVSNFSIKNLELLLPHCKVIPVMNQVEVHPYHPQNELKEYCEAKGIKISAYSPIGQNSAELLGDSTVASVAEARGITVGQVLLSWGVQRGTIVLPKSENEARLRSNLTIVKLSTEEMDQIDKIHTQAGKHRSLLSYHKDDGTVFGWSYSQLGWNMKKGGIIDSQARL